MVNLFLAFVWAILGGVLLYGFYFDPQSPLNITMRFTNISLGWLGLVLALYNVARWWGGRAAERDRQAIEAATRHRAATHHSDEPPNPAFNFTDPVPPRTDITDRPPSPN